MKSGKILAVLLALILAFSCAVTAFAADAFTDVAEDAYYAAAVDWAVEKGITNGVGNGLFAPNTSVNRAQAVTFLWRMAGEPEPTQFETFTDVEADANNWWYKTAVQWAVEKGITNGMGNGEFQPTVTCSRGMILTMLYRLEGKPWDEYAAVEVPENEEDWTLADLFASMIHFYIDVFRSEDGLSDIPEGEWYEMPVFWAVANGILNENHYTSEDLAIHPLEDCPRGEMVYFLYAASGEAPASSAASAVETGTLPETVLLEEGGAKVTLNGIGCDNYGDPRLTMTIENGTDKTLRADVTEFSVNTYSLWPQVYFPETNEDGWIFYADAVAAPGETKEFYVSLSSLSDAGIDTVRELEFRAVLAEVEKNEDDYYDLVDDFAEGELVSLQTSLYDETVSYDMEGKPLYGSEDLTILLVKAENDDFSGPQIVLYAYNSGSKTLEVDVAELKLDGKIVETFFNMEIPAGKRCVSSIYIGYDYDNVPVYSTGEITLKTLDGETWETLETFEPVSFTFKSAE